MTNDNPGARNNDGPNETGVSSRALSRADSSDLSDSSKSKDQTPQAGNLPESSGSEPDNICDPQDHGHVLLAKLASRTKKYHLPAVENPAKPACHHGTNGGRAKDAKSWTQVDADSPRLHNKTLCKWCDPTIKVENNPGGQELAGRLADLDADDVLTDGGRPESGGNRFYPQSNSSFGVHRVYGPDNQYSESPNGYVNPTGTAGLREPDSFESDIKWVTSLHPAILLEVAALAQFSYPQSSTVDIGLVSVKNDDEPFALVVGRPDTDDEFVVAGAPRVGAAKSNDEADVGADDISTDGGKDGPITGDWPSADGAVVDADSVSNTDESETLLTDNLRAALEESDCHPDMVRYAESAAERGGTPILNSLRHFHLETDVSRIAEIGTAIEQTLWNDGAQATLDRHGHVEETNSEVLREIAGREVPR